MSEKSNKIDGLNQFKPVEDVWFDDNTSSSIGTVDFDKTISNVSYSKDGKISVINNPNAHFFNPSPESQVDKNEFIDNVNQSNQKNKKSKLRDEIILMREQQYLEEQRKKEEMLSKINVSLNGMNSDISDKKFEQKQTDIDKPTKEDKIKKEVTEQKPEDLVRVNKEAIIEAKIEEPLKKLDVDPEKVDEIQATIIKTPAEELQPPIQSKMTKEISPFGNSLISNDVTAVLNPIVNKEVPVEHNMDKIEKILQQAPHEFVKDKKLEKLPVLNDFEYTLANTVDDFDKIIYKAHGKNAIDDQLVQPQHDNTTFMINGLINESENLQKLRNVFQESEFDDFEDWFKKSKEIKKLKKLSIKENKKMLKSANRK